MVLICPDKFKIITSTEGSILSGEDYLERAEQALVDYPGCVMCIDRFSSLSPSAEQVGDYSSKIMGGSSSIQAKWARRTAPIMSVNRNIVLGIVHFAPNFGYGAKN